MKLKKTCSSVVKRLPYVTLLLIMAVLLVGCGSGSQTNGESESDWEVYKDAEEGFRVKYRPDWTIREDMRGNDVYFVMDGTPTCGVRRQDAGGLRHDQLSQVADQVIKDNRGRESFSVEERGETKIGPHEGYKLIYSHDTPEGRLMLQQRLGVGDRGFVVLTCGVTGPERYRKFRSDYERFYDSFRWLNGGS